MVECLSVTWWGTKPSGPTFSYGLGSIKEKNSHIIVAFAYFLCVHMLSLMNSSSIFDFLKQYFSLNIGYIFRC